MLISIIVVMSLTSIGATSESIHHMLKDENFTRQRGALMKIEQLHNITSQEANFNLIDGGIYLSRDDNKLHVNIVGQENMNRIKNNLNDANTIFHNVDFSIDYLMQVKANFRNQRSQIGAYGAGIDTINNRVYIELKEYDEELINRIKESIDENAISFRIVDKEPYKLETDVISTTELVHLAID